MPSDDLRHAVREALGPARQPFRSALAATLEEIRAFLEARTESEEEGSRREASSLGAFAAGRVDATRFHALRAHDVPMAAPEVERVERAASILRAIADRGDALGQVRVPWGGSLRDALAACLADLGRAFGAAHVVAAARAGRASDVEPGALAKGWPFARWTRRERTLVPPILVEVAGADLQAPALAEFLDGQVKIVLVVDGPAAPAPLARLVTPGTYVLQTTSPDALAPAFAGHGGPGVAAVLPEGAAVFRHDPARGATPAARLEVGATPEAMPRHAVGGISVLQQAEDLAHLRALATAEPAPAAPEDDGSAAAKAPTDPSERLASWLLHQARLDPSGKAS